MNETSIEVLTRAQVAKRIGVCPDTISNWVRSRGFPCKKISRTTLRFVWSLVLEWLKDNGEDHGSRAA